MICPRCNCTNEADAQFCKNCGLQLYYYPPQANRGIASNPFAAPQTAAVKDNTLYYLFSLLGFHVLSSLWLLLLQRTIIASMIKENHFEGIDSIYKISSSVTSTIMLLLVIVFSILTKNKTARTFLIVYGAMSFLLYLAFTFWR